MDGPIHNYASALFDLAKEDNKVEKYLNDTKLIHQTFLENPDFIDLLSSYFLENEKKEEIIDEVFSSVESKHCVNFIKVILSNHQIHSVPLVLEEFFELCNGYLGVKKGIIYSTVPLDKESIRRVEETFLLKKKIKVELVNQIDTSLIGGVKVVISDHIFDGSLKNRLESLKNSLTKEGEHLDENK